MNQQLPARSSLSLCLHPGTLPPPRHPPVQDAAQKEQERAAAAAAKEEEKVRGENLGADRHLQCPASLIVSSLCRTPQILRAAEKDAKAAGFASAKGLQKSKQVFKVGGGAGGGRHPLHI